MIQSELSRPTMLNPSKSLNLSSQSDLTESADSAESVFSSKSAELDADGWYSSATRLPSSNFDARSEQAEVSLLVIHNISLPAGQFGGSAIADLFLNQLDYSLHPSFESLRGMRLSSHFLIRRDGSLLQFVSTAARAWHAGVSQFNGKSGCNDFSVGVELEGTDTQEFEAAQYQTLVSLSNALCQKLPIRNIVGHQDIAPGRKTDPGSYFDWKQYKKLFEQEFRLVLTHAVPSFPFML